MQDRTIYLSIQNIKTFLDKLNILQQQQVFREINQLYQSSETAITHLIEVK